MTTLRSVSYHIKINFNLFREEITQPRFVWKYLSSIGIACISISILTKIPPLCAIQFIHIAYLTNQVTSALFATLLEPYKNLPMIKKIGQFGHVFSALFITNIVCSINHKLLSGSQIFKICCIFYISFYLAEKGLDRLFSKKPKLSGTENQLS